VSTSEVVVGDELTVDVLEVAIASTGKILYERKTNVDRGISTSKNFVMI